MKFQKSHWYSEKKDPIRANFHTLKRKHCVEPYLKDKKKLCKSVGINTDIVVSTTTQVEVKTYTG
jgi:transglutaminase/protease-like cytokinesis protein 3